ncbi:Las1-domain-containing protein [Pseudovirgaria hyperparasitica]|uniref:Las1-domain-containing protein n=1 Tax=Pseudovirgaria hyperparasitica TaxID=470096 RepID=A0A6A6WKR6_9PEZI|nr:Las1-domain-containing protein [Pseudovirgaria hyperparasitica]KAF2762794.1 Las1-domain-containing protein [Pseudovirgaria hyperparasitica]
MDEGYGISHLQHEDADYQVTPWKTASELLIVRAQLFGLEGQDTEESRKDALQRIYAWQARGVIPLPVESTALLVQAQMFDKVQDDSQMAMRMVYATAVLRFVTAICDAFQPNGREKLPMQTIGTLLKLPPGLVETRHDATHKVLPTLKRLQHATEESLTWLWNYYWKDIDQVVSEIDPPETEESLVESKTSIQAALRAYLTSRKSEVKKKVRDGVAGPEGCRECLKLCGKLQHGQAILVGLLVGERMILPADRELGSSMEGAFLLWNPLFLQLDIYQPRFLSALVSSMTQLMNASTAHRVSLDPVKEAMFAWLHHILTAPAWGKHRAYEHGFRDLKTQILADCFSNFTHWSQKLAAAVLETAADDEEEDGVFADWAPVMEACMAATAGDGVDSKVPADVPTSNVKVNGHDKADFSLPSGWTRVLRSQLPNNILS